MNVLDAARERLAFIFREFDNVYVSFSGGKDSGALLHLCLDYLRYRPLPVGKRLGIFHIDYEAQYQFTTDYVAALFKAHAGNLDIHHCCMPIAAGCATSMHQAFWTPWDYKQQSIWVRPMPANAYNEQSHPFGKMFRKNMTDYDFQERFGIWSHTHTRATRTCALVGIRSQESLHRWRAVHSERNYHNYAGVPWTTEVAPDIYNAYPIHDWKTEDVWTANARFEWPYNKLYDVYYQAGLPVERMRVSSPFHEYAIESLKLYRVVEPHTWAKMVGRVNGVNFAGIYGGTTAMGWKSITLPRGHTWKSYLEFLLSTLPRQTADAYKKKLEKSIDFWRTKGGCLDAGVVAKLAALGVPHSVGESNAYRTDKLPVCMEYQDDVDIDEFQQLPTYKRMCVCVMKNDHLCKYMGFSLTKREQEQRKSAETKFSAVPSVR